MSQTPLKFKVLATQASARASCLFLPHGEVQTPVYMPVGTKGAMKGLTPQEMRITGCNLLLCNTYHLASKPGTEYIEKAGGMHHFMKWDRNILTDSGGFQMVSLSSLCTISEVMLNFNLNILFFFFKRSDENRKGWSLKTQTMELKCF
jgi:queuine tRNA-ribosyltransferase catalytic subunit